MNVLLFASPIHSHSYILSLSPHVLGCHGRKDDISQKGGFNCSFYFKEWRLSDFSVPSESGGSLSAALPWGSPAQQIAWLSPLALTYCRHPLLFRGWSDLPLVPGGLYYPERCCYPAGPPAWFLNPQPWLLSCVEGKGG